MSTVSVKRKREIEDPEELRLLREIERSRRERKEAKRTKELTAFLVSLTASVLDKSIAEIFEISPLTPMSVDFRNQDGDTVDRNQATVLVHRTGTGGSLSFLLNENQIRSLSSCDLRHETNPRFQQLVDEYELTDRDRVEHDYLVAFGIMDNTANENFRLILNTVPLSRICFYSRDKSQRFAPRAASGTDFCFIVENGQAVEFASCNVRNEDGQLIANIIEKCKERS